MRDLFIFSAGCRGNIKEPWIVRFENKLLSLASPSKRFSEGEKGGFGAKIKDVSTRFFVKALGDLRWRFIDDFRQTNVQLRMSSKIFSIKKKKKKMTSKNLRGMFPELEIKKGLCDFRTSVNVEEGGPGDSTLLADPCRCHAQESSHLTPSRAAQLPLTATKVCEAEELLS